MVATSPQSPPPQSKKSRLNAEKLRNHITGLLFVSPATLLIIIFGIFPIGYAAYMSVHEWRVAPRYTHCLPMLEEEWRSLPRGSERINQITKTWELDFATEVVPNFDLGNCFAQYTDIIGSYEGLGLFLAGFALMIGAWLMWGRIFEVDSRSSQKSFIKVPALVRLVIAFGVLMGSLYLISIGWNEMINTSDNEEFLQGLIYTVYYAIGSIPLQLGLGLLLAYVLYRNIWGKEFWRIVFFLPYITPAVAAAVVFRIVFSPRETSLANQFITTLGFEPLGWIQEPTPILEALFGIQLQGFFEGPSVALVSVILLGIWTYVGYNAVIFLAGMGNISNDLYEAARVDGANEYHLFRFITLPLLSPVTFYLSILGFIGTFKAFNTLFVMRDTQALRTTDTASIVVFLTFRQASDYGLATAQAILLLIIILVMTQFQRSVLEKRVFYG